MTIRQNSGYENEWGRNDKSRYGYGFNSDPLGYSKSYDDLSAKISRRQDRKQDYCADRSNKCNSLNNCMRPPQSNSWFDAWNLGNKGNHYSLTNKDFLPADMMMSSANLPSWLNNGALNIDSFLHRRHFDEGMIVAENERAYIITMAIPGCDRKDVSVNIREHDNNTSYLDVSWHFARQSKSNSEHLLWMGSNWGSGSRSLPIPASCDKNSIRADMKNGSLVITVPKEIRGANGRGRNKSINLY